MHFFLFGIIGTGIFYYKNPDKNYIKILSALFILIFSLEIIYDLLKGQFVELIWIGLSITLCIIYSLRYSKKENKNILDLVKLFVVFMIALFPVSLFDFNLGYNFTFTTQVLSQLTIPITGTVLVYDKYILKGEKMKKKFIVILAVQTFLIIGFLLYAVIQKIEADKQREMAEENAIEAEKQHKMALQEKESRLKIIKELEGKLKNCDQK